MREEGEVNLTDEQLSILQHTEEQSMTSLEQLEAALAAATEGPWRCDRTLEFLDAVWKYRLRSDAPDLRRSGHITDASLALEDAELIALLRNMAPDLIRIVKAAQDYANLSSQELTTHEAGQVALLFLELREALAPLVREEK